MNTPSSSFLLGIGESAHTEEIAITYLQYWLCPQGKKQPADACMCSICDQISHYHYYGITWVRPSKPGAYIVSDLDIIFHHSAFLQEQDKMHFFIITHADRLSLTCSNRLLKILEEPPYGYYFLALAHNEQAILPTIRSRAQLLFTSSRARTTLHPLSRFLLQARHTMADPFTFESLLKEHDPSAQEANAIAQEIYDTLANSNKTRPPLDILLDLIQVMRTPAQPGGGHIFLKNLFFVMVKHACNLLP